MYLSSEERLGLSLDNSRTYDNKVGDDGDDDGDHTVSN
jgi:hypothetical protein